MSHDRKFKRRHLIYYLQVREQDTDKFLGYLVDISYQGCLLMSQEPMEVDKKYQLKVMIPSDNGHGHSDTVLNFEGLSKWCNNDYNPEFYDTGFQLENVAGDSLKKIYGIIEKLGFKD